ncbi:TetR/AcrR family transcriptional regulator [Granulicella sp. WH15]|uniref:TetR/AcrR family transcriptional regulator n=1 Tax=Granulicella sp. WH15 TaxID=2602070 RepID=UPI0013671593|nr:TetR/AcrR family transcriptional regulator [Granulicella sp. WH15]QHN03617.1 TetR/AcrR family transcriptional regulator [Granulicella sp. WH15]
MNNDTASRIRESAHDLMAERGYFGFSYANIAESVGIRKASIHHHYPSKIDLAVATLKESRASLVQAVGGLDHAEADPLRRLKLYIHHLVECIHNNHRPICIAALLSAELPALPDEIQVEVKQHFDFLLLWVKRTLKEGAICGNIQLRRSAEMEAQSFVALVHGAMLSARALGSPALFHSITEGALNSFRSRE